jgi:hypothetical protein
MLRFFLVPLLCALFVACSSDDSAALNEWFGDQGIVTSYGKEYDEIEVSLKNYDLGHDTSAYMVSSFAALGNVNNVEQILYFGLEVVDSPSPVWKLRTDSIFYADFHDGKVPEEHKEINAEFCWLVENKTLHDSLWLKFTETFMKCENINLEWKAGSSRDTFYISLPTELLELKFDTLRLLAGIKLLTNNAVLRIAPPSTSDIPGLLRVAQKTRFTENCDKCLRAGVRESLDVVFEIDKNEIKTNKTIVFAQLVLPKSSHTTGSELEYPVPVYVYSDGSLEDYRVDTAFVNKYGGHPNLLFWGDDTLKLQVTKNLRNYINVAKNATDLPKLKFTLRLGNPMLNPKSLYFYNSVYSSEKVFSDRPAYSSYDFSTTFAGKAKLRLWYAD